MRIGYLLFFHMQVANYNPIIAHFSPTYNPQRVFICNYHLWQNVGGFGLLFVPKMGKNAQPIRHEKEIAFYGYLFTKGIYVMFFNLRFTNYQS